MPERAWRKLRFDEAAARPDLLDRARRALALGPLCDPCLGRLFAEVGTGLGNEARGKALRRALDAPPAPDRCTLCHNLFDAVGEWVVRGQAALDGWEFDTLAVASRADPAIAGREAALWDAVGGDLAEPYKQDFNRRVGIGLCGVTGRETDLAHPDIVVLAHHATGEVTLRVEPLYARGRYRKLVRGMPQCRWRAWPTSVQQIIGDPVCAAAEGEDHGFHGCGREDTDVRCLGERPFVLEVARPRRRRLDWAALAACVGRSGKVEVLGLEPCPRAEVARLKALRPEKTYRAVVRLARDVAGPECARLADLVGVIRQQTPHRVLKRRPDRLRRRCVRTLECRPLGPRALELTVRAQAGTYIKELVSGDGGRTRPSVAEQLGTEAECAELDVLAIHLDEPGGGTS